MDFDYQMAFWMIAQISLQDGEVVFRREFYSTCQLPRVMVQLVLQKTAPVHQWAILLYDVVLLHLLVLQQVVQLDFVGGFSKAMIEIVHRETQMVEK
jgi:hypothetical protein